MFAIALLFLREGVEAALVVGLVLAALRKMDRMHQVGAVWWGVGSAIILSGAGSAAIYFASQDLLGTTFLGTLQTAIALIAVVMLTSVTFWMQSHSRSLGKELQEKIAASSSSLAIFLIAFTAVSRETIETALFMLAFALRSTNPIGLVAEAFLGTVGAIIIGFMIYRLGYKLNYRIFFRVMGLSLLIFAAGLLVNAVQDLQFAGYIEFGLDPAWNTSALLSESSVVGDLLHRFFGYAEEPSILQVIVYTSYLLITGGLFWKMTSATRPIVATTA